MPAVAEKVVDNIELRHHKAKVHYDKQARALPQLDIGQTVKLQPLVKGDTWEKGRLSAKWATDPTLSLSIQMKGRHIDITANL